MVIKKLTLDGFKSVEHQSFDFDKGIICFSGGNGEGKSTVIHAMLILLFNTYELSFKDYINWNRTQFKISIVFEHEGEEYFEDFEYSEKYGSKRILKKISTEELWENSVALSKLSEIIDSDLARASIVSMENEQNLITTTPAKRREYLKGVYNLEFKEQLDTISKDMMNNDNTQTSAEAELAVWQSQVFEHKQHRDICDRSVYQEAKDEIVTLQARLGELMLQKQKRSQVVQRIDEENLSIRRNAQQIGSIETHIRMCEIDIEHNSKLLEEKNAEDLTGDFENRLEELKTKFENENSEIVKHIQFQTAELNFQEVPDQKEIDVLINKIFEQNKEVYSAEYLVNASKSKLEVMKQHKCPTCGHEITEEEYKKEVQDYDRFLERYNVLKKRLDDTVRQKDKLVLEKQTADSKISAAQSQISSLQIRLSQVNQNYESEKLKLEHALETYTINKENEILRYKTVIENSNKNLSSQIEMRNQCFEMSASHRKELARLEEELSHMDNPEAAINEISLSIQKHEKVVEAYEDALRYNQWVDEYNLDQDEKAVQRDKKVHQIKADIDQCNERRAMLERAKVIVNREFPSFVISHMVQSLEDHTNEFLQKVYPKYSLKITESKNSLAITYGPKNADVKMASGFEKSAFSLAYMYALGKMQKYGLLIVDEGDGAASDANSLQFYNTLAKSQEFFPQIFCITHKEVAKDLLENTYRAEVYTVEGGKYHKL